MSNAARDDFLRRRARRGIIVAIPVRLASFPRSRGAREFIYIYVCDYEDDDVCALSSHIHTHTATDGQLFYDW